MSGWRLRAAAEQPNTDVSINLMFNTVSLAKWFA
jgi:hypothetical protein